ncbi:hypothetical protein Y023_5978 [Burkholderia pseudomallei A79D]|nr:hypothetical protein X942_6029 [Burkholderia pseudomallei MSHR5596]KGX48987.1 hypothetical protein Y025_5745 [Burkholderia pseudomallei TSV32]KGX50575.1 hypothetical protein Y024_5914 [Burkholderia pseudomallei TSV44]KGX94199.1 hypothetical protein Y023_5978 [Burkholderia pseudomallei A79D]
MWNELMKALDFDGGKQPRIIVGLVADEIFGIGFRFNV